MKPHKFAAITSNLLARKGDARPWQALSREPRARVIAPEIGPGNGILADSEGRPSAAGAKPRRTDMKRPKRFSVAFSPAEFERLGIAAVKRGVSRQQVVRDAIESHLAGIADTLSARCDCLSDDSCQQPGPLKSTAAAE